MEKIQSSEVVFGIEGNKLLEKVFLWFGLSWLLWTMSETQAFYEDGEFVLLAYLLCIAFPVFVWGGLAYLLHSASKWEGIHIKDGKMKVCRMSSLYDKRNPQWECETRRDEISLCRLKRYGLTKEILGHPLEFFYHNRFNSPNEILFEIDDGSQISFDMNLLTRREWRELMHRIERETGICPEGSLSDPDYAYCYYHWKEDDNKQRRRDLREEEVQQLNRLLWKHALEKNPDKLNKVLGKLSRKIRAEVMLRGGTAALLVVMPLYFIRALDIFLFDGKTLFFIGIGIIGAFWIAAAERIKLEYFEDDYVYLGLAQIQKNHESCSMCFVLDGELHNLCFKSCRAVSLRKMPMGEYILNIFLDEKEKSFRIIPEKLLLPMQDWKYIRKLNSRRTLSFPDEPL